MAMPGQQSSSTPSNTTTATCVTRRLQHITWTPIHQLLFPTPLIHMPHYSYKICSATRVLKVINIPNCLRPTHALGWPTTFSSTNVSGSTSVVPPLVKISKYLAQSMRVLRNLLFAYSSATEHLHMCVYYAILISILSFVIHPFDGVRAHPPFPALHYCSMSAKLRHSVA